MCSRIAGLFALGAAVLLGGCENPLDPDKDGALAESQSGRTNTDPQSNAWSISNITVFWTDNASNETGWQIHRSTNGRAGTYSLLVQTAANVTDYGDAGLTPMTEYCYRIRSFRISGRKTAFAAFTVPTCATTLGAPIAVTDLRASPIPFGEIYVAWTFASFQDQFRIERAAGNEGPWLTLATLSPWAREYRDTGRASEQQVCYRIIAFNDAGNGPPSSVACTIPPAAPSELVAEAKAEQNISLSWVDNSAAEDGFVLERALDDLVWSWIATLPVDTRSYEDHGLAENTRYWYRVRANKDLGSSQFSNRATAVTASAPPAAPTGTEAHPSSSSEVTVYWWPAGGPSAGSFRVERSTNGGASWITAGTVNATVNAPVLHFLDVGRTPEERVCYQVYAINWRGESQPSNQDCTTPPAAPSNLRTSPIDDQTYEIRWDDNSTVEEGYILWLYEGYYEPYYPVELPANTTSYQISTSTSVDLLVAYSDGGYSDWVYGYSGEGTAALQVRAATRRPPSVSTQFTPKSFLRKGADR